MAVRTRDELIESLNSVFGVTADNPATDEQIQLLEDLSDTMNEYADNMNWKQKYLDTDADWRRRYTERFMGGGTPPPDPEKPTEEDTPRTFDELFVGRR